MFTLKLTINLRLIRKLITKIKLWVNTPQFKTIIKIIIRTILTITFILMTASVISNLDPIL